MPFPFVKSFRNAIKHWYIPLLVGIFFVIAGIIAFTSPVTSLLALSILFAISFLFGGISEIIFSVSNRNRLYNWGWSLTFGIITLLLGILLLSRPELSLSVLIFYIGFTILFRSVASISFAIDLKRYGIQNWGGLLILGILGGIFSFVLLFNPGLAGITIVWFVALSFFFSGLFHILFSFQLRRVHRRSRKISKDLQKRYRQLEEELKREWEQY